MNNSAISDLNNSTKMKQIWQLGNKYLVIIDNSIIEKLDIAENITTFLEQEFREEDNSILMKIKKMNL